jgi:hypothetical protein
MLENCALSESGNVKADKKACNMVLLTVCIGVLPSLFSIRATAQRLVETH